MTRCECIQCGYDLTPLVRSVREAATCPECGHVGLPAPINFMGLLRSRQRTVFYMILPMLIAAPIVLLLRLAGFHLYGMPMLIAVPAAVLVPTIVCTTREGRGAWPTDLEGITAAHGRRMGCIRDDLRGGDVAGPGDVKGEASSHQAIKPTGHRGIEWKAAGRWGLRSSEEETQATCRRRSIGEEVLGALQPNCSIAWSIVRHCTISMFRPLEAIASRLPSGGTMRRL